MDNDLNKKQKQAVKDGYNAVADLYQDYILKSRLREQSEYLNYCLNTFQNSSRFLDLGCGSGMPTTAALAQKFDVLGIDISETQIALAEKNVPNANFICADICNSELGVNQFSAVVAFYSLFHIPRTEIEVLLCKIYNSLKPQGQLIGCFLAAEEETLETMTKEMRNAPMFRSGFSPAENLSILEKIGFKILKSELSEDLEEDGETSQMFWVIVEK